MFMHRALAQTGESKNLNELYEMIGEKYEGKFEFSVLIEMGSSQIFAQGFGYGDKRKKNPITENTLFNIASISKSITSVGIMKLVEQGKISLSTRLGEIFENVPPDKQAVTIKTLLSHKSGLNQSYPLDGTSGSDQALQIIMDETLEFVPESGFRYSNQNYQLLALIIERVTQSTYEDFIREKILVPLKMHDTYFWDEMKQPQNVAQLEKRISRSMGSRNWAWIGGAGIFSTTMDLYKFWNGIYRDEFLSEESKNTIFDTYHETSSGTQIGFGFYKSTNTRWNTPELWTRGTESWGHNAVIRYFPEKDVTIIVATNSGEIGEDRNITGNRIISDFIADYLLN